MKKLITFLVAVVLLSNSFASTRVNVNPSVLNASEIFIPIGKDGKKISLLELSKISKTELEKMTGRKMNGVQSAAFKGAQKKLNKGINKDGIVTNKKLRKMFTGGETGFHFGGFALGFFLGLIGVLVAYLLKDDFSDNRRKWAWIGLGAAVVLSIVLVLVVFNTVANSITP